MTPAALAPESRAALDALPATELTRGAVLFRPGDAADHFVLLRTGRIEVFLTGPTGREILLYTIAPGEACVQTTLGLMAGEPYTGEAVVAEAGSAVLVPRALFERLIAGDPAFRRSVLTGLGRRMADVTRLLERVAFSTVEARLAETLLALERDGTVQATQADLAARLGSAREVVSRRLEALSRRGLIATERGSVRLLDRPALRQLAATLV